MKRNFVVECFSLYQNVMILGDFNADGSYLSKKAMKAIRIRSDKKFHWLIEDDVDTTANTGNDNTYDRWRTEICEIHY
jgi:deoxyribonuclease-1-like protein